MNQGLTFRQTAYVVGSIAVVQFILQLGLLARGIEYLTASLTIDDTYYYLQTAWNTKELGFVTFDGLHSTNGVQLLWFVVNLILAFLAPTKTALLLSSLALGFALNALCYAFILKIGESVKQPPLALFLAGLWSLQSLPFRIYSMGMENSLHALVIWYLLWQCLVFLLRVQNKENLNFGPLTFLLVLNVWTRLDAALLSAILFCACLAMLARSFRYNFRPLWQNYGQAIVGSSLLAGAGLAIQLAAFYVMGDSILPISALIKTGGPGRGLGEQAVNQLSEVFLLGMPSILQGRLPAWALTLSGGVAVLFILGAYVARSSRGVEQSALLALWSCLLLGEVAYQLYVAVSGVEYRQYFVWYRSPSFIFWTITGAIIALLTMAFARRSASLSAFLKWVPAVAGPLLFALATYLFARSINFTSRLYAERYETAVWIAENYTPNTVFAAWNAGQLSYFSNRTFINLDGLINSLDYFEQVLNGPVPLNDYLIENDVAFVVDYSSYDSIPNYPVVQTFPLNDGTGRAIHVWAVSPQASSVR